MYCSIKEAAQIIGVTRPTIYRMIEDGELKREVMLGRPALKLSEVKREADRQSVKRARIESHRETKATIHSLE